MYIESDLQTKFFDNIDIVISNPIQLYQSWRYGDIYYIVFAPVSYVDHTFVCYIPTLKIAYEIQMITFTDSNGQ